MQTTSLPEDIDSNVRADRWNLIDNPGLDRLGCQD